MLFKFTLSCKQFKQIFFFILTALFLSSTFPLFSQNAVKPNRYIVGISPKHKFVWFRVAKVGTSTIKYMFRTNGVKMPYMSDNFKFSSERYKDYFKFAFVRNPWDRVVSCYCQKVENKNPNWAFYYSECFDKGFEYFVDFLARQNLATADRHIRLQTKLIPVKEMDFIGRMDNFAADLQYVLGKIGIKEQEIPRRNPSTHAHYSHYYNEQTKAIVAELYKEDIETFGFEFKYKP
jgi:hypothetical protein